MDNPNFNTVCTKLDEAKARANELSANRPTKPELIDQIKAAIDGARSAAKSVSFDAPGDTRGHADERRGSYIPGGPAPSRN